MEGNFKRQKTDHLPNANSYERSYMHRDNIVQVLCASQTDFIFTVSDDGLVKFWKKSMQGIEFVKTFRAGQSAISSICLSANQLRLATCCPEEKCIRVFDVLNFDLINMIKVNFTPQLIQFVSKVSFSPILAATELDSNLIRLLRTELPLQDKKAEGNQTIIKTKTDLHDQPITFLKYNHFKNYCVSFAGNVPEIWDPDTFDLPKIIQIISDTDLLLLCESTVISIEFSP